MFTIRFALFHQVINLKAITAIFVPLIDLCPAFHQKFI